MGDGGGDDDGSLVDIDIFFVWMIHCWQEISKYHRNSNANSSICCFNVAYLVCRVYWIFSFSHCVACRLVYSTDTG